MRRQFVIARFNEDIVWADQLDCKIIYDKSQSPVVGQDIVQVPNVGREAETYLRHIISQYDNLADFTVFCQGKPFDHCRSFLEAAQVEGDFRWLTDQVLECDADGRPHHWCALPIRNLFSELFKTNAPHSFWFGAGAQFMVSRDAIIGRPLEFYKLCYEILINQYIEHGPWVFERLWGYIFCGSQCGMSLSQPRLKIYCYNLDSRWHSFIDTLFLQDKRICEVKSQDIPDVVAVRSAGDALHLLPSLKPQVFIILDLADLGSDNTDPLLKELLSKEVYCIYVKLQIYNRDWYRQWDNISNLCIVSCPLLLGGSAIYIATEASDAENLFINNTITNPKNYIYDYSFVGVESYPDRDRVLTFLKNNQTRLGHLRKFIRSTRACHIDARKDADIPFHRLMNIMRSSRINISLNGHGMWCLKDGELFSRNCFNLRQHHPNLMVNPLTPKDGLHWSVFKDEDVVERVLYYIDNASERETLNDNGFQYFSRGLRGEWAAYYVDRLLLYIRTKHPACLGELIV